MSDGPSREELLEMICDDSLTRKAKAYNRDVSFLLYELDKKIAECAELDILKRRLKRLEALEVALAQSGYCLPPTA